MVQVEEIETLQLSFLHVSIHTYNQLNFIPKSVRITHTPLHMNNINPPVPTHDPRKVPSLSYGTHYSLYGVSRHTDFLQRRRFDSATVAVAATYGSLGMNIAKFLPNEFANGATVLANSLDEEDE